MSKVIEQTDLKISSAAFASSIAEASCTLSNLAFYFHTYDPNPEKSIEYALDTIAVLLPIVEDVPFTQQYLQTAIGVAKRWVLSAKDIDRLILKKITNQ